MITHYIYHIPGTKVGCCKDFKIRRTWYPANKRPLLQVIEELHDMTDQEAGDREWEWADHFGYKRGKHYTKTTDFLVTPEQRAERRKKMGQTVTPEQRIANGHAGGRKGGLQRVANTTPEQRSEWSRRAAHKAAELGVGIYAFNATATPEQFSARARKRVANMPPEKRSELAHHATSHLTSEQRSANARLGAAAVGKQLPEIGRKVGKAQGQCPHCGLKANLGNLHRWHFEHCRLLPP